MILIDTNVVISGVLVARADSPSKCILDKMLAAGFPYLLSHLLLQEYRMVLLRPAVHKRHQLNAEQVDELLLRLTLNGMMRELQSIPEKAPHSEDDHLWQLLATSPGSTLVTGDLELIKAPPTFAKVLSPRLFWEQWR